MNYILADKRNERNIQRRFNNLGRIKRENLAKLSTGKNLNLLHHKPILVQAHIHTLITTIFYLPHSCMLSGPGSSVGIVIDYRLDGPGIESGWRRDFSHSPDRPWGPPSLLYNGYRVFPGGEAAGAWC
jgi:hypothetical protein